MTPGQGLGSVPVGGDVGSSSKLPPNNADCQVEVSTRRSTQLELTRWFQANSSYNIISKVFLLKWLPFLTSLSNYRDSYEL